MKFVCTREYQDFRTDFYVLEKTEKYLKGKKINLAEYLPDDKTWYEKILFSILKEYFGESWSPEKSKRKNLKVIYYGVVDKTGLGEEGEFEEDFEFYDKSELDDCMLVINKDKKPLLAVKEKIIILK